MLVKGKCWGAQRLYGCAHPSFTDCQCTPKYGASLMCTRNHRKGEPSPGEGRLGTSETHSGFQSGIRGSCKAVTEEHSVKQHRSVLSPARSTEEVPVGSGRAGSGIYSRGDRHTMGQGSAGALGAMFSTRRAH